MSVHHLPDVWIRMLLNVLQAMQQGMYDNEKLLYAEADFVIIVTIATVGEQSRRYDLSV